MRLTKLFENGRIQAVKPLKSIKRSWLDIYRDIKPDPDFMNERDDFPSQEREDLF